MLFAVGSHRAALGISKLTDLFFIGKTLEITLCGGDWYGPFKVMAPLERVLGNNSHSLRVASYSH